MNNNLSLRQGPGELTVPAGALYAHLLPGGVAKAPKNFFGYGNEFLPILAGATLTATESIESDSNFLLVGINIEVRTDAIPPVLVANPALLINLNSSGSGRNFFSKAMPIANVCGTAQLPGILPFPILLDAGSTFATILTNNQGVDVQVRTTFMGVKVFGPLGQ